MTFFVCLLLWLLIWFTAFDSGASAKVISYLSIVTHFDNFAKGVLDPGRYLQPVDDLPGVIHYLAIDGIAAVVVMTFAAASTIYRKKDILI